MGIDTGRIYDAVLELSDAARSPAWKGFDRVSMDRLNEKGFIHDSKSKARSMILTAKGERATREPFERLFGR